MDTWENMSRSSLLAAKQLFNEGNYRSSISRSYYAACCAATFELNQRKSNYPNDRNNPPHAMISQYIVSTSSRRRNLKYKLRKSFNTLLRSRIIADYIPLGHIDQTLALNCLRFAGQVQFEFLGETT